MWSNLLKRRMNSWIRKRVRETGKRNPMLTQGDWHGHEGVGAFKSSQQAYDTMHIGDPLSGGQFAGAQPVMGSPQRVAARGIKTGFSAQVFGVPIRATY